MKLVSLLSLAAFVCSGAVAQQQPGQSAGIAITAPALGTVWTAGKTEVVSWTVQDSTVSNIDSVELRNGGSTNLQLVGQVGSKIPVSGGQWEWDIPVDTKSDASYVLVFTSSKGSTYSPYFTIMAAPPGAKANFTSHQASSSASASGAQASSSEHSSASHDVVGQQTAMMLVLGTSLVTALFSL
ncbi:hypothetical protein LRAMOSA09136 [Lichtheimia ramosa]|uniref:Yeast cell wall synthesis Kre9/Knh1-like N-terminal domain-containing protein n=1 Tax=Lichtheimia ramosa TaxID=688394 RepID=A0A077WHX2_9FUNG|nr:hypothetical protein LRAMOSA09136 [Lichtheimia ramosa]